MEIQEKNQSQQLQRLGGVQADASENEPVISLDDAAGTSEEGDSVEDKIRRLTLKAESLEKFNL